MLFPLQSWTCVKIVLPLLDRFKKRPASRSRQEEKGNELCGTSQRSVHDLCICWCGWWSADKARAAQHLQQAQAWTLDLFPISQVFKSCFCSFFSLCIHYMVVVNTSLWEGQSFKIEENNFHKNIKNGKKLLFKKFAIQTKWQLLKISLKWE